MARAARYDRQTALDKAVILFWERGYHGTSMKQLEQALDMRPGSLYATFGSKDELFAEALQTYASQRRIEFEAGLAGQQSIMTALQNYLRQIAAACAPEHCSPSRACMLVKTLLEVSNTHEPLSEQANAALERIETGFEAVLKEAQKRGELAKNVSCARLARLLQAQVIGLRSYAQRSVSAGAVEELGEDMAAILEGYRRPVH